MLKTKTVFISGENLEVSDGFHSFVELYSHRIILFVCLMRLRRDIAWKCKSSCEDWFIGGLSISEDKIVMFNLPSQFWDQLSDVNTIEMEDAPEWNGRTDETMIKHLIDWCKTI